MPTLTRLALALACCSLSIASLSAQAAPPTPEDSVRADNLRDVGSGMLKLTSVKFDSLTVRIYGGVAILQGITDNEGTMGGIAFSGRMPR